MHAQITLSFLDERFCDGGQMPLLEIRRDRGYADRLKRYEVWVDDSVVGELRDGEVKQFPVASGEHELRIKIDWCGSRPVMFSISEEGLAASDVKSGLREFESWAHCGVLWLRGILG
jgi:hypothetical protein